MACGKPIKVFVKLAAVLYAVVHTECLCHTCARDTCVCFARALICCVRMYSPHPLLPYKSSSCALRAGSTNRQTCMTVTCTDAAKVLHSLNSASPGSSNVVSGLMSACSSRQPTESVQTSVTAWTLYEHAVGNGLALGSIAQEALWASQTGQRVLSSHQNL